MTEVMQVMTDTNIGGAGIWLLNFLKYFDRDRLCVTVVIPENSALKERIEELGVRYIQAEGIADESFSKQGISVLKDIISREKPDVVHTHASLSARIAAKLAKVPVVNTRHCLEPPKTGIKKTVYGMVNRVLSAGAVAVSQAVRENLVADGFPADKVSLVYNGVVPLKKLSDEERCKLRAELGFDGCVVAGIFARLEPVKNHRLFLEAAAAAYGKNKKLRFLIVGDGSIRADLEKDAEKLGLCDAVTFAGYVKDVTQLMNVIDINVLTSDREALSISLVEGMTLAKPCVTTDAGGTREVVEDGKSGFVVPVGDAEALTKALLYLADDEKLRESFGEEGRKIAAEKFSPEEMCMRLAEMYERIAKN